MAVNKKVKLTRDQLAQITEDHGIIKQLELLIDLVNELEERVAELEAP